MQPAFCVACPQTDTPKCFLITTATALGLSQITTLTSLKLRTCALQLSILSSLRNLRELDLSCVGEHRPASQPADDHESQ